MERMMFIYHDPIEIVRCLVKVCGALRGQKAEKPTLPQKEIELMLLTIASESAFGERKQKRAGPARGLTQMEPRTALDTFRWLEGKPILWKRLTYIWLGLKTVPWFRPTKAEVSWHLMSNDPFCLALSRCHYKMFPKPFPESLHDQGMYWKKYWNTEAGKGSLVHAMESWNACNCRRLMRTASHFAVLTGGTYERRHHGG